MGCDLLGVGRVQNDEVFIHKGWVCSWLTFGCLKGCFSANRFALKLLDKKRIKVKKGEMLAINEKNMLAKVCDDFGYGEERCLVVTCGRGDLDMFSCLSIDQQSVCSQSILRFPDQ